MACMVGGDAITVLLWDVFFSPVITLSLTHFYLKTTNLHDSYLTNVHFRRFFFITNVASNVEQLIHESPR